MENYKFGSVKLELGVSGYMDILILNTYPPRSSTLRDNGMGNTLVLKRRGEGCRSCAIRSRINSHVLVFCLRFAHMGCHIWGKNAHGIPFVAQLWHDLTLKPLTRGFQLKKEMRWRGAEFDCKRKS